MASCPRWSHRLGQEAAFAPRVTPGQAKPGSPSPRRIRSGKRSGPQVPIYGPASYLPRRVQPDSVPSSPTHPAPLGPCDRGVPTKPGHGSRRFPKRPEVLSSSASTLTPPGAFPRAPRGDRGERRRVRPRGRPGKRSGIQAAASVRSLSSLVFACSSALARASNRRDGKRLCSEPLGAVGMGRSGSHPRRPPQDEIEFPVPPPMTSGIRHDDVRQPGCPKGARGFASRPLGRFAFVVSSSGARNGTFEVAKGKSRPEKGPRAARNFSITCLLSTVCAARKSARGTPRRRPHRERISRPGGKLLPSR